MQSLLLYSGNRANAQQWFRVPVAASLHAAQSISALCPIPHPTRVYPDPPLSHTPLSTSSPPPFLSLPFPLPSPSPPSPSLPSSQHARWCSRQCLCPVRMDADRTVRVAVPMDNQHGRLARDVSRATRAAETADGGVDGSSHRSAGGRRTSPSPGAIEPGGAGGAQRDSLPHCR